MVDFDERLNQWDQLIQNRLSQAEQLRTAVAELQVKAESEDGTVVVTLDGAGNVTDLYIAERALRSTSSAADLSDSILACINQAKRRLVSQIRDLSAPIVGADTETMAAVDRGLHQQYRIDEENRDG